MDSYKEIVLHINKKYLNYKLWGALFAIISGALGTYLFLISGGSNFGVILFLLSSLSFFLHAFFMISDYFELRNSQMKYIVFSNDGIDILSNEFNKSIRWDYIEKISFVDHHLIITLNKPARFFKSFFFKLYLFEKYKSKYEISIYLFSLEEKFSTEQEFLSKIERWLVIDQSSV